MEFLTQFNSLKKPKSVSGSGIKIIYASRYDKSGHLEVVPKGKENLYEKIQSFADSVDINLLVKRFLAGDTEALNRRKAMFMDTTDLPEDYFDAVNKTNDMKEVFRRLPADIKDKFKNNPDVYLAEIGTKDWFEKLGYLKNKSSEENKIDDHNDLKSEEKGDNN